MTIRGASLHVLLTLVGIVGIWQQAIVQVSIQSGAGRCLVGDYGGVIRLSAGAGIPLSCAERSSVLRCDFDEAEPLDTTVGAACDQGRLFPAIARPATLQVSGGQAIQVSWLDAHPGEEPSVIASRRFDTPRLSLNVSDRPSRFLRVFRSGRSPVTVSGTAILSGALTLPPTAAGGEAFLLSPQVPVHPESLWVRGPSTNRQVPWQAAVSIPSIEPGRVSVTPIYKFGLRGLPVNLTIAAGRSTSMTLKAEDIGALTVRFAGLCKHVSEVGIARSVESESDAKVVSVAGEERLISTRSVDDQCAARFSGLPVGEYVAYVGSAGGRLAERRVRIDSQIEGDVELTASGISVAGAIKVNGRPFEGVIRFVEVGKMGRSVNSDVSGGQFLAELPRTGRYVATLEASAVGLLGYRKELDVQEGVNPFDWTLESGTIAVTVLGFDPKLNPMLRISAAAGGARMSQVLSGPSFVLPGVVFDQYVVSVVADGAASRAQAVNVSREHPDATVTLDLRTAAFDLTAVDDFGRPIENATATTLVGRIESTGLGRFRMTGVPPGSAVTVAAPGRTPACKVAPVDDRTVEATLAQGRTVTLELGRAAMLREPLAIQDTTHSECPVRLNQMGISTLSPGDDGLPRLLLTAFPTTDRVVVLTADGPQLVEISPAGVGRIK